MSVMILHQDENHSGWTCHLEIFQRVRARGVFFGSRVPDWILLKGFFFLNHVAWASLMSLRMTLNVGSACSTSPALGLQASINNMPGFIQWWGWNPGLWLYLASLCQPSSIPAPLQVLLMLQHPRCSVPSPFGGR